MLINIFSTIIEKNQNKQKTLTQNNLNFNIMILPPIDIYVGIYCLTIHNIVHKNDCLVISTALSVIYTAYAVVLSTNHFNSS